MEFHDKLSFLLDITKTTNSSLAMASSLDSSYISRLRNGKRKPVKSASYLKAFARFFSKRIHSSRKNEVFRELLLPDTAFPEDEGALTEFLYNWFVNNDLNSGYLTREPLRMPVDVIQKDGIDKNRNEKGIPFLNTTCGIYQGVRERRLAAVHFLSVILKQNSPRTLLFFSDEDMSWMIGDPVFYQKWSELMGEVIAKGNRIKIIHDLTRGLDEILSSIQLWVPLYMSGAVEPYYYPRKRDGIYKRSLYIAPGLCAVSSNSIGMMAPDDAIAVFHQDPQMVQALENEFNHYLTLCQPLMSIFTPDKHQDYLSLLESFEKENAPTIIKTPHLSMLSMPNHLMDSVLFRIYKTNDDKIRNFYRKRRENFQRSLNSHNFTEIFSIPEQENLLSGKARIALQDPFVPNECFYTQDEYHQHFRHVSRLLERYQNYKVCIEKKGYALGYTLYAKENKGVIVAKTTIPAVVLFIRESNLLAGFWDFLIALQEK